MGLYSTNKKNAFYISTPVHKTNCALERKKKKKKDNVKTKV